MTPPLKLGLSGIKGSFTEAAAKDYTATHHLQAELVYCLDMEGTLRALNKGEIDRGIFPVTNSIGGLVETAYEAMGHHPFELLDKMPFEVEQCLFVHPDVKDQEGITEIASHPQALTQCRNYLAQQFPHATLRPWSDTATAARDLAKGELPPTAAILGAPILEEVYGLHLLARGVNDQKPNTTTFIVVGQLADLGVLRDHIQLLDQTLIDLLAQRFDLVKQIKSFKEKEGQAVEDKTREQELLATYESYAEEKGLPPNLIKALYATIFAESKRSQRS